MGDFISRWEVAPHGLIGLAIFALIVVMVIHALGFRVVGAVRIGS